MYRRPSGYGWNALTQNQKIGVIVVGVLVVAGLVLRYPVQHELKTLWWFGPWG